MSGLTFDATDKDDEPRVFAGMHRPPRINPTGYVMCTCGMVLQTTNQLNDHWQSGHMDRPLYHVDSPALVPPENTP